MVSRNYLSIFLVALFSVTNIEAGSQNEIRERFFDDCILHEVDGRIWLKRPMVYLGMWGVIATPPFCMSDSIATKFKPLVSEINISEETSVNRFYTSEEVLRRHKGNLILVSLNAKMQEVYDEETSETEMEGISNWPPDMDSVLNLPDYNEIIEADLHSVEFVSAEWIEAWRTIDKILQDIVDESRTPPCKEKSERLAVMFEKGESILSAMSHVKPNEDFRTLVGRVDPNSQVVQKFARQATYRWQEWFEKFAARLGIKLNNLLPEAPKLWIALEALAKSESLEEFQSAKEKIPPDSLELLYGFDLGQKVRALEIGQTKDYKFETLRASAEELLPEVRESEERSDKLPETIQKGTIEEFGLVLKPVDEAVLTEKKILLGLEVESVSADKRIIGIKKGDIIIYYDHVYDVVMSWYGIGWQKQILTGIIRQGRSLRIIRGDGIITLDTESES